ncbi:MAG: DNA-binding protein [Clostridiaceae bacterium]|nr:DNA-binding protein [Clostridiaceae bacterium]
MILGFDTSNYKTSVALYDDVTGFWRSEGKFLEVDRGLLGLRQSEALFQHVKAMPEVIAHFSDEMINISAIGYSDKPREVEGSYMPCFLAGKSLAKSFSALLSVPAYSFSHQQGHLASALFSINRLDMLKAPFLAWHLSGGTTELLLVKPDNKLMFTATIIGGTKDISAGQAIDRCGVALSMPFPAGKYVEESAILSVNTDCFTARCDEGYFSLSGLENKFKAMIERGERSEDICRFTLCSVSSTVLKVTKWAMQKYSGLPVVFSGGVSVCSILREYFKMDNVFFAEKGLGGDNALGAAILAQMEMNR